MLSFCSEHDIRPAIKTFPAAEVNTALEELAANTLRYRAVLEFPAAAGSGEWPLSAAL